MKLFVIDYEKWVIIGSAGCFSIEIAWMPAALIASGQMADGFVFLVSRIQQLLLLLPWFVIVDDIVLVRKNWKIVWTWWYFVRLIIGNFLNYLRFLIFVDTMMVYHF